MPRQRDPRERILGPYRHHRGWRVIHVRADGVRTPHTCESEADALQLKATLEGKLQTVIHTTDSARDSFLQDLKARKLSPRTLEGYEWALKTFWPTARPLHGLTVKLCTDRYNELVHSELSTDSHRNALKMAKTFLRWCVGQGWLKASPLEGVKGVGKRNKGKPQLRLDEARRFYLYCLERAAEGDLGAVAALMALTLTMRSEREILATTARDIDDGGKLLVIERSKTRAGERTLRIPEDLRPALLKLVEGKQPHERLFRRGDRKWLWEEVARLCTEASVPRVSPHGLRGSGSTAASASETTEAIARMLGHASTRVTEQHYINQEAAKAADQDRRLTLLKGERR